MPCEKGIIEELRDDILKTVFFLFVFVFFCHLGLRRGDAVTEPSSLIVMEMTGFRNNRNQVEVLNCQSQGGCNYHNEQ